ncbi:ubiquitin-conjugating enzyme E2 38 [Populus alba x Populus x berolinensis]|nr:ubiquitin-conjugating enzyme E2 38 [Populus alba x Populus x berolinensis]
MDLDMADGNQDVSISKKLKQSEVVLCDVMDAPAEVLICHGKADMGTKGKSKSVDDDAWQQDIKNASSSDLGNYTSVAGSVDSAYHLRGSTSGSTNSNNNNGSNSDMSYHDDEVGNDCDDYADENDCDDLDGYLYYDDEDEDDYSAIQSQFDNVDLPPGVEASLPWLKEPASSSNMISNTSTSTIPNHTIPSHTNHNHSESKIMTTTCLSENKWTASASSSMFPADSSSNGEVEDSRENNTMQKYRNFKQFDNVEDFSDHHYRGTGVSDLPPPKIWAKRIQDEWKSLEKDLPDTIFVRVYETRMELLRAVIAGPAGTPYHDGLFVFDCIFPPTYPDAPPMVYYYSGGLRLNPNLYECGKVCLSLLGTWSGKETEMWIPGKSTMLQVLVSIQALILNAKPFFNEPGYESSYVGAEGDKRSKKYNEEVFILSLKTMMYTLRRPPKHFEDLVIGHFQNRAHNILVACKAYADGAIVGSVTVKDGVADVDKADMGASGEFKATVKKMINPLVANFTRFGSINCERFRIDDR